MTAPRSGLARHCEFFWGETYRLNLQSRKWRQL